MMSPNKNAIENLDSVKSINPHDNQISNNCDGDNIMLHKDSKMIKFEEE